MGVGISNLWCPVILLVMRAVHQLWTCRKLRQIGRKIAAAEFSRLKYSDHRRTQMDQTTIPVRLPDGIKDEWKRRILGQADRQSLVSEILSKLEIEDRAVFEIGMEIKKLNSPLSRFLNGDGREILKWLTTENRYGRALERVLQRPNFEHLTWLAGKLQGPKARRDLFSAGLSGWPLEVSGPAVFQGGTLNRESLNAFLKSPSRQSRETSQATGVEWVRALEELVVELAKQGSTLSLEVSGKELPRTMFLERWEDRKTWVSGRLATPSGGGRSIVVSLTVADAQPLALSTWLDSLSKREDLLESEVNRVKAVFGNPTDFLARFHAVLSVGEVARLANDAASGEIDSLGQREIAARSAAWALEDLPPDVVASAERCSQHLVTWLKLTGGWKGALSKPDWRRLANFQPDADFLERLLQIGARAVQQENPEERGSVWAEAEKAFGGRGFESLLGAGLFVDRGSGTVIMEARLRKYAERIAPLRAEPSDGVELARHLDGFEVVRRAVAWCGPSTIDDWLDVAVGTAGLEQPTLALAVLDGLSLRKEDCWSAKTLKVWASAVWMVATGLHYPYIPTSHHVPWEAGILGEFGTRYSAQLPCLGTEPVDGLRELVDPRILDACRKHREETEPSSADWNQLLCELVPLQIPFSLHEARVGEGRRVDRELLVSLARLGDQDARRICICFEHAAAMQIDSAELVEWAVDDSRRLPSESARQLAIHVFRDVPSLRVLVPLIKRFPDVINDEDLIQNGFRACFQEDPGLNPWEPGDWPDRRFRHLNIDLYDYNTVDIVAFASELGREAVLHAWAKPKQQIVNWACKEPDLKKVPSFEKLERLAGLRNLALLAFITTGAQEHLCRSSIGPWKVQSDEIARQRRMSRIRVEVLRTASYYVRRSGELPIGYQPSEAMAVLEATVKGRKQEPFGWSDSDRGLALVGDYLADRGLRRESEDLPAVVGVAVFLDRVWLEREQEPVSDALRELSERHGDEVWTEPDAAAFERARALLLAGDEWALQLWQSEIEDRGHTAKEPSARWLSKANPLGDWEVAGNLWEHIPAPLRRQILRGLPAGHYNADWRRRARRALDHRQWLAFMEKFGSPSDKREALNAYLECEQSVVSRCFARRGSSALPLGREAVADLVGALASIVEEGSVETYVEELSAWLDRRGDGWLDSSIEVVSDGGQVPVAEHLLDEILTVIPSADWSESDSWLWQHLCVRVVDVLLMKVDARDEMRCRARSILESAGIEGVGQSGQDELSASEEKAAKALRSIWARMVEGEEVQESFDSGVIFELDTAAIVDFVDWAVSTFGPKTPLNAYQVYVQVLLRLPFDDAVLKLDALFGLLLNCSWEVPRAVWSFIHHCLFYRDGFDLFKVRAVKAWEDGG